MYDMNMNECVIDTELIFGALFIAKSESGNVDRLLEMSTTVELPYLECRQL